MKIIFRQFLLSPVLQTIIIIAISLIVGLLSWYFNLRPNINKEQFLNFLTLFAQLSGILLGFLIGFFFFTFQSKEAKKMQWFLEYRKTVDELVSRFVNLPENLYYLSEYLGAIIERLEDVTIDDFPNDNLKDSYKDIEKIVTDEIKIDPIFNREILYIARKLEEYSNNINLTIVGIWTSVLLIKSIYKQLALLMFSILFLFLFAITDAFLYPNFMLVISIAIGTSTTLGFAELVLFIQDFYRNRLSEINSR